MSSQIRGLSDKDRDLLDALLRNSSLTAACKELGISVSLGSRRKTGIVTKYLRAKEYIKEVDEYKTKLVSILGI